MYTCARDFFRSFRHFVTLMYSRDFILSLKNESIMSLPLTDEELKNIVLGCEFLIFPKAKEKDELQELIEMSRLANLTDEEVRKVKFDEVKLICEKEPELSDELFDKIVEIIGITSNHRKRIAELCVVLMEIMESTFEDCSLVPFGSSASGIGTFDSDVDLYLDLTHHFTNIPGKARRLVPEVWKLVWQRERFRGSVPVRHCRVPVVRIKDRFTGMKADLSISSRKGVENTTWLKFCAEADPRIKNLMILFKWFCKQQGISGSGIGDHLNGYACMLLVVFFLQVAGILPSVFELQENAEEHIIEGWNFAFAPDFELFIVEPSFTVMDLLIDLFHFYSNFKFAEDTVCCYRGLQVSKQSFKKSDLPDCFEGRKQLRLGKKGRRLYDLWGRDLVIQDPFELDRNVTGNVSTTRLEKVASSFKVASEILDAIQEGNRVNVWMMFEPNFASFRDLKREPLQLTESEFLEYCPSVDESNDEIIVGNRRIVYIGRKYIHYYK